MKGPQKIRQELALVADMVRTQVASSSCSGSLKKPDFWMLGYVGGCCEFILNQGGVELKKSTSYTFASSTFTEIFGAEKGSRMAAYFITFRHADDMFNEVSDFDVGSINDRRVLPQSKEEYRDFLQQVRGIYRTEVFDKFRSLASSIQDVIKDGANQAERDLINFFSRSSPAHPRGLADYLMRNKGG